MLDLNIQEVKLDNIKNKNEERVKNKIQVVLSQYSNFKPDALDIQDIYALSLNSLPPRYRQKYSIVLQEPVKDEEIINAIKQAIQTVFVNPRCKNETKMNVPSSN